MFIKQTFVSNKGTVVRTNSIILSKAADLSKKLSNLVCNCNFLELKFLEKLFDTELVCMFILYVFCAMLFTFPK